MTTPQTSENPFVDFIKKYRHDPVAFVKNIFKVEPDEWQTAFLEGIRDNNRRISVRSGHGVGKSTAASWAMLWYLLTRYPVKVVVTAPTSSQLFDALFAEIKRWVKEMPPALSELLEVKSDRIELRPSPTEAFISARTSRAEQPEALQGIHSDNVMLVADEASGVPEAVFEAAAGSMSGHNAVTILLGNPVRSTGYFYETHNRLKDEWFTLHVNCEKSKRVSKEFVREMAIKYGEDSNAYRVRVLGEFPLSDDDTMIPFSVVEQAMNRDIEVDQFAQVIYGIDVARFGSDKSALAKKKGNVITEVKKWKGLDLMQLVGAIKHEYESEDPMDRPTSIYIDSIGLGSGVVDRLRELGLPAIGINVSESPAMKNSYVNLRAELWGKMKNWLEQRGCAIPKDDDLLAELTAPRYSFNSSGRLRVESKDEMKKRGLSSPDLADACILTLAGDAAVGIYGSNSGSTWAKPLKRLLKGVV
jgi:phage terminase large subunit